MTTTPENKATILSELWMTYRDDEEFEDLIAYADLALPLCYAIDAGLIKSNDKIAPFIDEAFDLLLAGMEIEDTGFENLDEILMVQ